MGWCSSRRGTVSGEKAASAVSSSLPRMRPVSERFKESSIRHFGSRDSHKQTSGSGHPLSALYGLLQKYSQQFPAGHLRCAVQREHCYRRTLVILMRVPVPAAARNLGLFSTVGTDLRANEGQCRRRDHLRPDNLRIQSVCVEAPVRLLGRTSPGLYGSMLAMSWNLFQKVFNMIIFYGGNLVKYISLTNWAEKQLKPGLMPSQLLDNAACLILCFGAVAAIAGIITGRRMLSIPPEESLHLKAAGSRTREGKQDEPFIYFHSHGSQQTYFW